MALVYAACGLVGGVVFVLIPPMVTDPKGIVQHVILGAIAGGIIYLGLANADPASIGTPLSYATTISIGYVGIDFITKFVGGKSSAAVKSGTNIPI